MVSIKSIFSLALAASTAAAAYVTSEKLPGCGKVDIFFTGLPPNHPLVIAQGYDPAVVDKALRADAAALIKAGYNLKVVFVGPEKGMSPIENGLKGTTWEGTLIGFGVRGSKDPGLTAHLEDTIQTFREKASKAYIAFNWSPDSSLTAIKRRFPLSSDCANSPGKDYGYNVICDSDVCK